MNSDELIKLIATLKGAGFLEAVAVLTIIGLCKLSRWAAANAKRLSSQSWEASLSTEDAEVRVAYTPKKNTSVKASDDAKALPSSSKPALRSNKSRRALSPKATTRRPRK